MMDEITYNAGIKAAATAVEYTWWYTGIYHIYRFCRMVLLPDRQNCGLRMRRECRELFPRHRLQGKPLVSDPGMHHSTCVTHVP